MGAKKMILALLAVVLFIFAGNSGALAGTAQYVPDELIVKFKAGTDANMIVNSVSGSKLDKKNQKLRLGKVKLPKGSDVRREMLKFKSNPNVEYAEPNYYFSSDYIPNDPSYNLQWAIPKIKADQAWDTTTGSSSVVIAVVDTGVDADHADLTGNLVSGFNTINSTTDTNDDYGHGTHVAGIAAGMINNGTGIAGVAGTSKIMPVKAMGSNGQGSTTDISEGIVWAVDHGAKVINLSLGSSTYVQSMQDAIDYAYTNGAIVIAAAGNSSTSALHYPAAMNHVVAVSATDPNNAKASFSNYGSHIDVAAPGTSIYSTTFDGGYGYMQGTSMATPYVSGVAALVLSQRPSLMPGQLETVLETSATDIGAAGKDIYFGYGLVNTALALTQTVDTSPVGLTLLGDSPDPFSPNGSIVTKITFNLSRNGYITLKIFDNSNNLVRTVLNHTAKNAGTQYATWNGKNDANVLVTSGTYSYTLQAEDTYGNTSSVLSGSITVDRTVPVISSVGISESPFVPNGSNTVSVAYNLSEGSKVTVKIYSSSNALIKTVVAGVNQNAGANSITWDGKNTSGVIVGDDIYTFKIDAVDGVNLKAVQQMIPVTVDRFNPSITLVSDSPDPFKVTGSTVNTIKFTISEKANVTVKIFDSGNNPVRTLINGPLTSGAKSVQWNGKNDLGQLVSDGNYTYRINAADSLGKVAVEAAGSISTDKNPPIIGGLIINPDPFAPTGSNTAAISCNLSETVKLTITIYNSSNAVIKVLQSNVIVNTGSNSVNWDGKNSAGTIVGDGKYTCKITATDIAGFTAIPATGNITVERSNPVISAVTDAPDPFRPTGTTTASIKYSLSEDAVTVIKIYDAVNNLVRTLVNGPVTAGSKSAVWNGKSDSGVIVPTGQYTYKIDAIDNSAKSAVQVSGTINVDVTPPVISLVSVSPDPFQPTGTNQVSISYSLSENSKVTISIYSSSNILIKTLCSAIVKPVGANSVAWDGKNTRSLLVTPGVYTYKITAVDSVNQSSIKTGTFTVQ